MSNNILYIISTLASLATVLFAFKLGRIWIVAYIAASIVLMNIFVLKQMDLFTLAVTGGNVLYSSIFLATDLLAEHYGKKTAVQAVRVGFFVAIVFLVASQGILYFTPNDFDFAQESFVKIFTLTPRIVIASIAAYLVSQHLDVFLFDLIKSLTGNKYLWLRNNISTLISQAFDSVIFNWAAFFGIFDTKILWQIILFTYLVKLIVALLDTPFIYLSKLKIFRPLDKN